MFITFEGIDFCGKSTQVELLKNFLVKQNKKVEIIREPGGTVISEKIRDILLDKKNDKMLMEAEIFLFSAARAQLVREKIKPFLEKGYYVISDRFHDSTTAYQGFGRGVNLDYVKNINSLAIGEVLPDITFFVDIPVEEAELRKNKMANTEYDRMEISGKLFFDRVRSGYIYLSENESRFRRINGTKPIEDIHKIIVDEIDMLEKRLSNEIK